MGTIIAGSFTYDTNIINANGTAEAFPENGLTLTATFLGQVFTETDDRRRSSISRVVFPIVEIIRRDAVQNFSFLISETNGQRVEIDEPGVTELWLRDNMTFDAARDLYEGNARLVIDPAAVVAPIPLPSGLALVFGGLGVLAFAKKRPRPARQ